VKPIYFGSATRRLFGVHHPPLARRPGDDAVLLCAPAMQEYMRTHWALRKLALLLAREGFHVLRFDYFGTGDSAGEPHEASVEQWCADIRTAASELADLSGARAVSAVGLRLGAAMAVLSSSAGLRFKDLVLWEPVVNGRAHVDELRAIERVKFTNMRHPPRSGPLELLCYPFPDALRDAIERIELGRVGRCPVENVLLFASARRPDHSTVEAALRDRDGRAPRVEIVAESAGDRHEGVLLSTRVQTAIAAALSRRSS
jgi:pimeloyl-ACP methyl ester carboxylesterase